jgi:hypothetical protein
MSKLFNFGVGVAIIGVILLVASTCVAYYYPPEYTVKLIVLFVFGAGMTTVIVGIVCIIVDEAVTQAVRLGVKELEVNQITPDMFIWSIIMVVIILAGLLTLFSKLSAEDFMQIISVIIGAIFGSTVTYGIRSVFKEA